MHSSEPCVQNNLHNNAAVNGGGSIWYTKERYRRRERMVRYDGWFRGNGIDSSTWHCQDCYQMGHEYSLTIWFCAKLLVSWTLLNHIFNVSLTATMVTSFNDEVESLYAILVWMYSETSFHRGQRNNNYMQTVAEIEVHWSLDGYTWIQWLGMASSLYSNS